MSATMLTRAESPSEPRTAEQERSQQVGQASRVRERPEVREGGSGDTGGSPPKRPPTDRDPRGGGRPERPSRWAGRFRLLAAALTLLSVVVLYLAMRAERGGEG